MPLLDSIAVAQQLTYSPPKDKASISEYTEEEVYEATLDQILRNPTITYGVIVCCKNYSPIKLIFKQALKRYIAKFSAQ